MNSLMIASKEQFESEVLKSHGKVSVGFATKVCAGCAFMQPEMINVHKEHPDFVMKSVFIDDFPDLADQYGIASSPTICIFKDGNLVGKQALAEHEVSTVGAKEVAAWVVKMMTE